MTQSSARWWIAAALVVAVACTVASIVIADDPLGGGLTLVLGVAYVVLGCRLMWLLPNHAVPRVLVGIGITGLLTDVTEALLPADGAGDEGVWLYRVGVALFIVFGMLAGLLLHLFPTGRPLTSAWRWATRALVVGGLLLVVAQVTGLASRLQDPTPLDRAVAAPVVLLFAVGLLSAFPSIVIRVVRARGAERAQLRWFLFGVAIAVGLWFVEPLFELGVMAPAVAIFIALSRHGLYEIDRIVSRTASYVVVTALVLGTYAVVVTTVSRALPTSSTFAVAAATLTAAAVARPLLRRVQSVVDRRFNRSRYDAQRTVDAFGERLRDEVESGRVVADLREVVGTALEPKAVALWMPSR